MLLSVMISPVKYSLAILAMIYLIDQARNHCIVWVALIKIFEGASKVFALAFCT